MTAPGDVRYARASDGIDIAYTVFGEGPDLLVAMGFVTHLDLMWEFPWHEGIRRLADRHRVIVFDKRGTGLSDRSLGFGSLEDRSRDIEAVLDAVESEHTILYGISEGGPMSVVTTVANPDRVRALILYGSMARVLRGPENPHGFSAEFIESILESIEGAWGTGQGYEHFVQHPPDREAALRALARYERNACTPQMAREILLRNVEIDVTALLPSISVPTLVAHCTGDPAMPFALGQQLAAGIPGARFVAIDGGFHGSWRPEDQRKIGEPVAAFLGEVEGVGVPGSGDRVLATILFTDIVDSTKHAVDAGDAAWRALLDQHDQLADHHVTRFGGRVVKSTGDGVLAVFDGPSRAVQCARDLHHAAAALGVPIRAGLHTGEVERRGEDVGGVGVHIAARVAALADAGEVLASRTVRDLTFGSDLEFASVGARVLKGVPDEWEIYRLTL